MELNRHIENLEDQFFSDPSMPIQRALEVAYAHYWRTNGIRYDVVQNKYFEDIDYYVPEIYHGIR